LSLIEREREPASTDKEPETRGKRQADRSDVRQEFVRKKPDPGFEPLAIADGRQPFMPSVSQSLPLIFPSVLPVPGGCGRFPTGA
jgi:hypothetical protein